MKSTGIGKRNREQGFSLVEMIIVIVVIGLITVSTMPFIKLGVDSYVSVRNGKDLIQSSRIGLNRFMAEMERIEEPSNIDYGYSNEIQFDIPGDNNITYKFDGYNITREGKTLIAGVQSFTIRYYKNDGTIKSTPIFFTTNEIWRVHVTLVVGDETEQVTLIAQVSPRNFHL